MRLPSRSSNMHSDHEPGDYIDEEMAIDEMETDGVDWVFRPTNPSQMGIRNRYRRLRLEMQILAKRAHEDVGDIHRSRNWMVKHVRAEEYMLSLLDAEKRLYSSTSSTLGNVEDLQDPEEPCYHKLGITSEFTDKVTSDFYTLQIKHDQPKSSYYLSALEAIARRRKSDELLTLFQMQKSLGVFTRQDLNDAYRILIAEPLEDANGNVYSDEDDETLINIAASMMIDEASQKLKIRTALEIVGKERDSMEIRKFLNTPERDFELDAALRYLGAEESTDDDFLITLYDIKQEDDYRLARSALETIADDRKNVRLRRFLDTGDRSAIPAVTFNGPDEKDIEMLDPGIAYSRLGVDDRNTDDDMLIMLYEIRVADDPGEVESLRRALELLGDIRNSQSIKNFIATGSKEVAVYVPPEASNDRPVGLENIGNTCYLNSLLQYYFTIRPLRQALLSPDSLIETEISDELLLKKKVGGRIVTKDEVERALRFMKELKRLFRSLIDCKAASLKPSRAVCFLALVSQRDESITASARDQESDDTLHFVQEPGSALQTTELNQLVKFELDRADGNSSTASSVANVDEEESVTPLARSPKRKASSDWEILESPHKHSSIESMPADIDIDEDTVKVRTPEYRECSGVTNSGDDVKLLDVDDQPLHISSSAEHNEARADSAPIESTTRAAPALSDDTTPADGTTPIEDENSILVDVPPLPPRGVDRRRQSSLLWSEMNDWGRQQDVAECIDNVLFQIEAALRPVSNDAEGEQIDLVKDLFYGATKQTLAIQNSEPKIERFSNTIVTLERDNQDIYEALDGVFDVTEVELGGTQVKLNLTVVQAPPILQVQIQRVNFDLKSMMAVKSNIYLALDQSIYLDRYMETDELEILDQREDYWECKKDLANEKLRKEELQNLIAAAQITGPQYSDQKWMATENEVSSDDDTAVIHLEHAPATEEDLIRRGFVHELSASTTSVESGPEKPTLQNLEQQLRSCEAKERDLSWKIGHLFDSNIAHEYRLHSVFIHRGEASHGHYWVYIFDFIRDRWMKYNDEEVSVVPREEVFKDRTGSNENPYMLSYVRADRLDLTSSLERDMDKEWEIESLI